MKIESKKSLARNILFVVLFSFFILSSSVFAQTIRICNESGVDLRVARFIYRPSSMLSLDCGGLGTSGCHSWLWNWRLISNGYCDSYYPGTFEQIYFAAQLKDKDGNWYSTSYTVRQNILNGDEIGWSGISGKSMCVKNDTYGSVYDRVLKGMANAVSDEVCQSGYSKFPVNLWVGTDSNTNFTVSVPYESPPVKKNYPNTYRDTNGRVLPKCGYAWANGTSVYDDNPGDYRVKLLPGFVATSTGVRPAKGFRWRSEDRTSYWCDVEKIPTTKKTIPKKRNRKSK